MTDQEFFKKNRIISYEFSKYVLKHPEIEDKIPLDAQVIFLLENDPDFNEKSKKLAEAQREDKQDVVFVKIKDISPAIPSRLIEPRLEKIAS